MVISNSFIRTGYMEKLLDFSSTFDSVIKMKISQATNCILLLIKSQSHLDFFQWHYVFLI